MSRKATTISSCKWKNMKWNTKLQLITKARGKCWRRIREQWRWSPERSGRKNTQTELEPPCRRRRPLQSTFDWSKPIFKTLTFMSTFTTRSWKQGITVPEWRKKEPYSLSSKALLLGKEESNFAHWSLWSKNHHLLATTHWMEDQYILLLNFRRKAQLLGWSQSGKERRSGGLRSGWRGRSGLAVCEYGIETQKPTSKS